MDRTFTNVNEQEKERERGQKRRREVTFGGKRKGLKKERARERRKK